MTVKIEVGKKYELNNGEVHECTHMHGDDPLHVNHHGHGPFVIDCVAYHQDGRFASYDADHEYSVKLEWTEDDDLNAICDERQDDPFVSASDTPKTWGDEDGWSEWTSDADWDTSKVDVQMECIDGIHRTRTRPRKPVRETVTLYSPGDADIFTETRHSDSAVKITYTRTDGKPDLDSIKMEEV